MFMILFSLFWGASLLFGTEINSKKYTLSICTVFKNEAKYLKEWIEYHRLIGIDHFYLYSIGSSDRYLTTLRPYLREGIVTLIHWPDLSEGASLNRDVFWALGSQIPALENAVKYRALHETQWIAFVDINEFLVPPEETQLLNLLEQYKTYPALILETEYFNASANHQLPKKKLVIESLQLATAPKTGIEKAVSKMIFKPECAELSRCAPFQYLFKEKPAVLKKKNLRINCYLNREFQIYGSHKGKMPVDNRLIAENELKELLETGYEVEDQEKAILRYLPEVYRKFGFTPTLD